MKKLWFLGIVVVLALTIAACNNVLTEPEESTGKESTGIDVVMPVITGQTEDGRAMMELSFPSEKMKAARKSARSLTFDLAYDAVDFYEVSFLYDGGTPAITDDKVYRASWHSTETGKIAVPEGNYAGATKAILFAGRESDKTLLAVGVITATNTTTSGATLGTVDVNTSTVTFTMATLTNNVTSDPATTLFKITGPQNSIVSNTDSKDWATAAAPGNAPVVAKFNGEDVPVFLVPKSTTAGTPPSLTNNGGPIRATYQFTVNDNPASTATYNEGIMLADLPLTNANISEPLTTTQFPEEIRLRNISVARSATATATTTNRFPDNGTFDLTFETTEKKGLTMLNVAIPVYAINDQYAPIKWNVQGGLNKRAPDGGTTQESRGVGVVLGIGLDNPADLTTLIELEIIK